jgi:hypothetical protein
MAASAFGIAVAVLALSMVSPVISSTTDFSIFNTDWNGTSSFAVSTYETGKFVPSFEVRDAGADLEVVTLNLLDMNLDPDNAALVIIGPSKQFGDSESAYLGAFVRGGGVLFLADDFGTGNSLLEKMGASSRFSGLLVMDLAFDKRPEFSVCFDFEEDPLTDNVTKLLLNYPSSVSVGGDAQVLARTSIASWLDQDKDRIQDWGEPRGPFPVLAREAMGDGAVILLSDPSVLINGMREQMDDGALVDNIVSEVCLGRSAVFFDESHRDFFSPVNIATTFAGELDVNIKVALVVIAFFLVLWISTDLVDTIFARVIALVRRGVHSITRRIWKRKAPEASAVPERQLDDLVHELTTKHPDWRAGIVRYLVKEDRRHRKTMKRD